MVSRLKVALALFSLFNAPVLAACVKLNDA